MIFKCHTIALIKTKIIPALDGSEERDETPMELIPPKNGASTFALGTKN